MTDAIRTPDELLEGLPDFPFEPRYRTYDGLRMAHLDEGEGALRRVLSRRADVVVPVAQGDPARCATPAFAASLPTCSASAAPTSQPTSTGTATTPMSPPSPRCSTSLTSAARPSVVHDWGGPIGLRLAVEHADRFDRIVILDTGLFTGHQKMSDAWLAFRDFVGRTEDLPVGFLVRGGVQDRPRRRRDRRLRGALPERRPPRPAPARSR